MLNKTNASNRRMIMSAEMLHVYQNNSKAVYDEDNIVAGYNKQHKEQLNEHDESEISVLGDN
jgi:hypothetical protein